MVVVDVVATVVVVEVGASDDATVVVVAGAVVVVAGVDVGGAVVVVVGATVVVVVEVVVVVVVVVVVAGKACQWAYRVKSPVWPWLSPALIWVPPDVAVYQPLKVYPVRVGSVGSVAIAPPVVVVASPSVTVEPPWLS